MTDLLDIRGSYPTEDDETVTVNSMQYLIRIF